LDRTPGATSSPYFKFHPNSKFKEETILNSPKFYPRELSDFSFEIHYESKEVSMERIVHLFERFKTIIYLKKWSSGSAFLGGQSFKQFKII
jgi:hypothetical protein